MSRYRDIARLLTGQAQAEPQDAVDWLRDLCRDLEIPPLRAYGLTESDLPGLLERAAAANSMRSNPISLTAEEMRRVVDLAA